MDAAGPSAPASVGAKSTTTTMRPPQCWLRSIDAVYALFEEEEHRKQHRRLAHLVQKAVRLTEEVLDELGVEHCALSFNGGKDCTVLVHLLAAVLRRRAQVGSAAQRIPQQSADDRNSSNNGTSKRASSSGLPGELPRLASLYITCSSPFPEVEEFVHASILRYNLCLVRQSGGMKEGLETYLNGQGEVELATAPQKDASQHKQRRDIKAIFVGTRRSDPHGADLKARNKTDPGWPDVERVQPILDWTYQDVWLFLRCPLFAVSEVDLLTGDDGLQWGASYGVPYCSLYDEGYTSLGSTYNTFPNPVLDTKKGAPVQQYNDERRQHRWLPAYCLEDESLERAGRGSSQTEVSS